jgi:P-type Ca2+ transporter type 2C
MKGPIEARPSGITNHLELATEDMAGLIALAQEDIFAALGSRPNGLTADEVRQRAARFGPNAIAETRGPGLVRRLGSQFVHLFALLLWAGSVLAVLAGEATLAAAIAAVVLINGLFGFWQEYRAQRAVAALRRLLPETARVVRDGGEQSIPAAGLVPGDVILATEGDRISADACLVEAVDLRVDQSALTGESHPAHKAPGPESRLARVADAHSLILAGTTVTAGSARGVVVRTGMTTEFGRIAHLTQAVGDDISPLQREVASVARRVALLSVVMGLLFFAVGFTFAGLSLRDGAIFAVGIVIANVPEGLLPTMTLSLAMSVQRMARRKAIVKRLSSVEALGSCDVICTDKTGTVTSNEMTVREVWTAAGRTATLSGAGYEPTGGISFGRRELTADELERVLPLLRIGMLCNAARLRSPSETAGWSVIGDPTEGALLVAAAKVGLDREQELALRPMARQLAFDPRRKRMSTVHRSPSDTGALVAYVKGAPRELLAHCTGALTADGEVPFTADLRARAIAENDRMASSGLRVLAMAYRSLPADDERRLATLSPGAVETNLAFVGLAAMRDPPRPEVRKAVMHCQAAGVRVIMITGDYGLTAEAIAREVEITVGGVSGTVDGAELDRISDAQLVRLLGGGASIFARTTPEHKLRIVGALQSMGHIVAVTGDGVNDAPALKKADIGVAMGRGGTDVAREAADMVILDDNFATIVAAIEEGRAIFDNMRKFIVYIFAHLSPEAIPFIFFALFHTPLPLTVLQILAIDLGTETLPALALGVERAEPDVMSRPPRRRSEHLLDVATLRRGYVFLGGMSTVVVLTAFFAFLFQHGWHWGDRGAPSAAIGAGASTVVFLGIVILQVGNAFACRTERASAFARGLLSNRFLLLGVVCELLFAAALIYIAPFQALFGTAAIDPRWWLVLAAFIGPVFVAEETRKLLLRRKSHDRGEIQTHTRQSAPR